MRSGNPLRHENLARQIALQKRHAWDLEDDISWHLGIDTSRYLLPLDADAIAFPGASAEQKLALSQFMGLVVNQTISEMEDALPKLKYSGWRRILREYPANPEMVELGEMFFDEEAKHSRAFARYVDLFARAVGVEPRDLKLLLPKAFGSHFQAAIGTNAASGGHAFWWVVASVEEVSIAMYHEIHRNRNEIDPLYLELHRRHLEEESRHANYAFLMLDLINRQAGGFKHLLHRKADFILGQLAAAPWVLTELYKFFQVKHFKHKDPFFEVLASCIPLYEAASKPALIRSMFMAAPYVSWLLNPAWRRRHVALAKTHGAIVPPMRPPTTPPLYIKEKRCS